MSAVAAEYKTVTRVMTVQNKYGIHARPAALFVKTTSKFRSDITLDNNGNIAMGKSIMGLLTLDAPLGTKLKVTASGTDAEEALEAIQGLIDKKFYED